MADILAVITLTTVLVGGLVMKWVTHCKLNAMDGLGTVRRAGIVDPEHNIGDF